MIHSLPAMAATIPSDTRGILLPVFLGFLVVTLFFCLFVGPERDQADAFYLEVISFGESAVANEGAGDAGEGEEVAGFALVASVQAPAAGEPGHGAFDGPTVAA